MTFESLITDFISYIFLSLLPTADAVSFSLFLLNLYIASRSFTKNNLRFKQHALLKMILNNLKLALFFLPLSF